LQGVVACCSSRTVEGFSPRNPPDADVCPFGLSRRSTPDREPHCGTREAWAEPTFGGQSEGPVMPNYRFMHGQSRHRVDSSRRANSTRAFCCLAGDESCAAVEYSACDKQAMHRWRRDSNGSSDATARVIVDRRHERGVCQTASDVYLRKERAQKIFTKKYAIGS